MNYNNNLDSTDLALKEAFDLAMPDHINFRDLSYYFICSYIISFSILTFVIY